MAAGRTVPPPTDFSRVTPLFETWPQHEPVVRVFNSHHLPNAFNSGTDPPEVRGRFHFFSTIGGAVVPILYGSDREDGAISETVFHDVPLRASLRTVLESRLDYRSLVTLRPKRDLRLAQLLGHGLRRLKIRAANLTDTEATEYRNTVPWAKGIHTAFPDADGLLWMSRQFNAAKALVLFGDRVEDTDLETASVPLPLRLGPGRTRVEQAANAAGILII